MISETKLFFPFMQMTEEQLEGSSLFIFALIEYADWY
jgi:hypothetical protein